MTFLNNLSMGSHLENSGPCYGHSVVSQVSISEKRPISVQVTISEKKANPWWKPEKRITLLGQFISGIALSEAKLLTSGGRPFSYKPCREVGEEQTMAQS